MKHEQAAEPDFSVSPAEPRCARGGPGSTAGIAFPVPYHHL